MCFWVLLSIVWEIIWCIVCIIWARYDRYIWAKRWKNVCKICVIIVYFRVLCVCFVKTRFLSDFSVCVSLPSFLYTCYDVPYMCYIRIYNTSKISPNLTTSQVANLAHPNPNLTIPNVPNISNPNIDNVTLVCIQ